MRKVAERPQVPLQVFVVGSSISGELGLGHSVTERRKPGLVKSLATLPIVSISCGGQHTLALTATGEVFSWGVNDQGALGRLSVDTPPLTDDDDDVENAAWVPHRVNLPCDAVQMVCADSFSAVLLSSGQVYAWGSFRDPSGILGFSKAQRSTQSLPCQINLPSQAVLLGSGENHIFVVTGDDRMWAFGANDELQLGRRASSRFKNNLAPYDVRGKHTHNIAKIAGGSYHTLYINHNGELYAFGCNNCGQLGSGDLEAHVSGPERILYAIDQDGTRIELPEIVDVAAGESHSIALARDGRVFTWGANLEGQLGYVASKPVYGDERDIQSSSPAKHVPDDREAFKSKFQPLPRCIPRSEFTSPIRQISAQSRFSAAIATDGSMYTWGSGHSYQLGNEEMDDEVTPYKVELKGRIARLVKCAGQFTMFLLEPKSDSVRGADGSAHGGHDSSMNYSGGGDGSSSSTHPGNSTTTTQSEQSHMFQSKYGNYRLEEGVLPTSPLPRSSPRLNSEISGGGGGAGGVKTSPTHLMQQFGNVCVSPKRSGMVGGERTFTRDEKMAPWSPGKKRRADRNEVEPGDDRNEVGPGVSIAQRIKSVRHVKK